MKTHIKLLYFCIAFILPSISYSQKAVPYPSRDSMVREFLYDLEHENSHGFVALPAKIKGRQVWILASADIILELCNRHKPLNKEDAIRHVEQCLRLLDTVVLTNTDSTTYPSLVDDEEYNRLSKYSTKYLVKKYFVMGTAMKETIPPKTTEALLFILSERLFCLGVHDLSGFPTLCNIRTDLKW